MLIKYLVSHTAYTVPITACTAYSICLCVFFFLVRGPFCVHAILIIRPFVWITATQCTVSKKINANRKASTSKRKLAVVNRFGIRRQTGMPALRNYKRATPLADMIAIR